MSTQQFLLSLTPQVFVGMTHVRIPTASPSLNRNNDPDSSLLSSLPPQEQQRVFRGPPASQRIDLGGRFQEACTQHGRPPLPREPLPGALHTMRPTNPFELDADRCMSNIRVARRGAAPGPSGLTAEHLFPVLENDGAVGALSPACNGVHPSRGTRCNLVGTYHSSGDVNSAPHTSLLLLHNARA